MSTSSNKKNKLSNIHIERFRKLKDIDIQIADRITVIAGHNGIGKSTILGLIANGSELSKHKSYFRKNFNSKFNEIFHLDRENDFEKPKKQSKKYSVLLEYEYNQKPLFKHCTISHPERLRVVPRNAKEDGSHLNKRVEGIGMDEKVKIPTLYLGMSRVIPIGESKPDQFTLTQTSKIAGEDFEYLKKCYKDIIGSEEMNEEVIELDFKSSTKRSVGPKFSKYSFESISLGQDSLNTILTAVISFKKLKRELQGDYKGGILVIDEVDACLHPAAQRNLLNVLDQASKELDLQIIVTTHSLTILKNVLFLKHQTEQYQNTNVFYNVAYIQDTIYPRIKSEPNYLEIKNDMLLQNHKVVDNTQNIKVYLEDEEAKFLFDILKSKTKFNSDEIHLESIGAQISSDTLIRLTEKDDYFSSILIVLDKDVTNKETYVEKIKENDNLLILPGEDNPEITAEKYLKDIVNQINHQFWLDNFDKNYTIQHVQDTILPELDNNLEKVSKDKAKREVYKEWFKYYKNFFKETNLFYYWIQDNQEEFEEFENSLSNGITNIKKNYINS